MHIVDHSMSDLNSEPSPLAQSTHQILCSSCPHSRRAFLAFFRCSSKWSEKCEWRHHPSRICFISFIALICYSGLAPHLEFPVVDYGSVRHSRTLLRFPYWLSRLTVQMKRHPNCRTSRIPMSFPQCTFWIIQCRIWTQSLVHSLKARIKCCALVALTPAMNSRGACPNEVRNVNGGLILLVSVSFLS